MLHSNEFISKKKKSFQLKILSQEALTSDESIGPILGQYGLNSSKFCIEFNERSFFIKKGLLLNVYLYFFVDNLTKVLYFNLGYPWVNFLIYHSINVEYIIIDEEFVELVESEILDLDVLKFYKIFKILGWKNFKFISKNLFVIKNILSSIKYQNVNIK